ncbi:MAG: PP2C family protein-serine/threonine phosphatase [Kofleriaceae bacterium]
MQLDSFALSIPGRRSNNEDAVLASPELGLFVVADGMGGYEGGEVASALAIEAVRELVRRSAGSDNVAWPYAIDPRRTVAENELLVAARLAHERIAARRTGALGEMGSTLAAIRIVRGDAVIAHVGDSRVYRLRGGALAQLTIDHSLLAELTAAGMAPDDPASFRWRHVVTRALGTGVGEPDVQRDRARSGDVYLVCSDGLSEVLSPQSIAAMLEVPAEAACRALVGAAFAAGSRDNISAIVVRVLGEAR